ncbi:phosphoribosyl-AMP cyclohydrolase [bacterium]
MTIEEIIDGIKFNEQGLVPAVVQDSDTNEVLMLAYMNKESFLKTIDTGKAAYWSRSRQEFWVKGETSGNIQTVTDIFIDCDGDTILLKVNQLGGRGASKKGAACHKGYRSCFFKKLIRGHWQVVGEKIFDPAQVYGKKKS